MSMSASIISSMALETEDDECFRVLLGLVKLDVAKRCCRAGRKKFCRCTHRVTAAGWGDTAAKGRGKRPTVEVVAVRRVVMAGVALNGGMLDGWCWLFLFDLWCC